jgi:hypothetical protein
MSPGKKILNKFNGLYYQQEYLCLSKESFEYPLRVYLVNNDHIIKNITEVHLFVGYNPLIFAFPSSISGISPNQQIINIKFSHESLKPNESLKEKDAIATLSLKKIHQLAVEKDLILFYEGIKGRHHFVSDFRQLIIQLNNNLYNKKKGNVFLETNLYKQVQVAYAIPRKICLATVGENNLYNHFPTDLHGRINDKYLLSLRHEGKACVQAEASKQIVLCDMNVSEYKKVYALGKNHMQVLKERSFFDFDAIDSKNFCLPLPKNLISYRELELENSFVYGIHKLLVFKIIYEEIKTAEHATLTHIHNCYATWRHKHRISSNLLLR